MKKTGRIREIKQKRGALHNERNQTALPTYSFASIGDKTKAFITDIFMLLMPIVYIVVYLLMEGREGFSEHRFEGWLAIIVPNFLIVFLFFWRSGQTPGCRAYDIRLVDAKTGSKAHPLSIALRYYFEIFSIASVVGLALAFFHKDKKCLHDLLSGTMLIRGERR